MPIYSSSARFKFIGHALRADGPFRPAVYDNGQGGVQLSGLSYLVRYPREGKEKYARRNELAFFSSALARACNSFTGYMSSRPARRNIPQELYQQVADDVDGQGNDVAVFLSQFANDLKARGSMLLLVDMPSVEVGSLAAQLESRAVPYWTSIAPEDVTEYMLGEDGRFDWVEWQGKFTRPDGTQVECTWRHDRNGWRATHQTRTLAEGTHPLGECPVLIATEGGTFPVFGPFSAIADLSKRLFNAESELDEILRAQTFSLLTMQVPDNASDQQKLAAAKTAGETVSTNNLLVHGGSTPAFIAPPDGPARVYLDRIKGLKGEIREISLDVATVDAQESGLAMQMRFQRLNGELARFAARMEDLERRAWELSRRWLNLTAAPEVIWPRDYNLADVESELRVLTQMRDAGMPDRVIAEQEERVVALQFAGMEQERLQSMLDAVRERTLERTPEPGSNVVPLRPDPNAELRAAAVRALEAAGGPG
jgi:hypothetical protein